MRKKVMLVALGALAATIFTPVGAGAAGPVTVNYGGMTLASPWVTWHANDVWDLTQGDLTLSYTIDMNNVHQPGTCSTYNGTTLYAEIGLRGEGAGDFNPGPWDTYQGGCGGWMVSDDDTWNDAGDGLTESRCLPKDSTQDLDDKHGLQASGGRGERDYDVLLSAPNTVLNPPIGSWSNYGIWYDRDGVDQWQDDMWGMVNGGTYSTGGIYHIDITYHAINDGLGVMSATINGIQQGFYTSWYNGQPQYYPAGLSFKGDMRHMQVFAGVWGPNSEAWALAGYGDTYKVDGAYYFDYGSVAISDLTATGHLGISDPLVPDFAYTVGAGGAVTFDASATHGGMGPYTYAWEFGDGATGTGVGPTHTYSGPGPHTVKLTVTPFRCTPQSVTKPVGWGYIVVDKVTDPAGSPQSFQFTPSYAQGFSLTDASPPNNSGALRPGSYSVAELVPLPAGWTAGPATCNDGSSVSAIGVSPGETVTCTFTNTRVPGTSLTISKVADPADGTGFSFGGDLGAFTLASGESETFSNLNPGEYQVTEALPADWSLDDVVCAGPAGAVLDYSLAGETLSVTVVQGAAVSCTFYNSSEEEEEEEEEAQLTIAKAARTENPELEDAGFDFTGDLGEFTLESGESESFDLAPGVYAVSELLVDPWLLDPTPDGIVCTGDGTVVVDPAAATVTVALEDGDDVTCTFHNYDEDTIGPDLPYTGTSGGLLPALLGGLSILVLGLGLWVVGLMKGAKA